MIHVAADRIKGRQALQLFKDFPVDKVTSMKDYIIRFDFIQKLLGKLCYPLRNVGIGDDIYHSWGNLLTYPRLWRG